MSVIQTNWISSVKGLQTGQVSAAQLDWDSLGVYDLGVCDLSPVAKVLPKQLVSAVLWKVLDTYS